MKKHILLALILASLISCTKTIDFDDEGFANMVVVNSIIWPDSTFSATLLKSSSILEERHVSQLAEGTVDLYENGNLVSHLGPSSGLVRDPGFKPKAGSSYRMVVTSNGQQIEAETTVPAQAEVISIDTMIVKSQYANKTMRYSIKIKDTPGDDFYRIIILHESLAQIGFVDQNNKEYIKYYYTKDPYRIKSDDPVFKSVYNSSGNELFDSGPENDYYIFPDDFFRGKEYTIQVETEFLSYYDPSNPNMYGPNKQIFDRFTVHVQRLSKELYNYLKYMKLYNHYHDNPFSEPVPVYSNVMNGTGIFAGFNDDSRFTFEQIYIPFSMDTITVDENHHYVYN